MQSFARYLSRVPPIIFSEKWTHFFGEMDSLFRRKEYSSVSNRIKAYLSKEGFTVYFSYVDKLGSKLFVRYFGPNHDVGSILIGKMLCIVSTATTAPKPI